MAATTGGADTDQATHMAGTTTFVTVVRYLKVLQHPTPKNT